MALTTRRVFHLCSQSVAYGLAQTYEEQLARSSAYLRAQKAAAEELLAGKLQLLEGKMRALVMFLGTVFPSCKE